MKRRIFLLLAALITLAAILPQQANALTKSAGTSAILVGFQVEAPQYIVEKDNRAEILRAYLQQYNSPLAAHAETFIKEADANNIDWKLVAAIAGVESYFGQMIPPYSYNGWGYNVYGSNVGRFASWNDGISVVSRALRTDYINARGASTIYEIGQTYAADPQWGNKVTRFSNEIDLFAKPFNKPSLSISI